MNFWWVNQGQTFRHEVDGGYLWSPKVDANGSYNHSYEAMTKARVGDFVFSYSDGHIRAIGVVQASAYSGPKPNFGLAGANWKNVGWYLEVDFLEFENPVNPKLFLDKLIPLLPEKYSPYLSSGRGNQKGYLFAISNSIGELLAVQSGLELLDVIRLVGAPRNSDLEMVIDDDLKAYEFRGEVEKLQLVMARLGQGVYRHNLRSIENQCRVTQVTNPRHLRASHMKPWSKSTNEEKIDGNNGLFLAPHVDHLFDSGYITFEEHGSLVISPALDTRVLNNWKLIREIESKSFTADKMPYLTYHQEYVFIG